MSFVHLIFDSTLCTGCDACARACRDEHLIPFDINWLEIKKRATGQDGGRDFELCSCRQCAAPACVETCAEGALSADADGAVQIDELRCTGCGRCVEACPHGALQVTSPKASFPPSRFLSERLEILRRQWLSRAERKIPSGCNLCSDRRKQGRPLACVAACRTGAMQQKRPDSQRDD
jgi:Fe-S-cluster-containing dehydrogenase component